MISTERVVQLDDVAAFAGSGSSIEHVSVIVHRGEAVAFLGRNDSGKSLALRAAAGLEVPLAGSVHLFGMNPAELSPEQYVRLRRRVGVVFDRPALISNMTIFNNVALPLRYHTPLTEPDIEERVMAGLREWGVEAWRDRFPAELPTGEGRLVAYARARILNPEVLFIDEILFGLDASELGRLEEFLNGERKSGRTLVISANAPSAFLQMMDRLVFFGDGRLLADCKTAEAPQLGLSIVKEFLRPERSLQGRGYFPGPPPAGPGAFIK